MRNAKVSSLAVLLIWLNSNVGANQEQVANSKTMVDAKAEVSRFVNAVNYQEMKQYPRRWTKDLTAEEMKRIVVELSSRLMNTREGVLTNCNDMFVPARAHSRGMRFHGHGPLFWQDIFLENGRCAWAIEVMLGCKLQNFSVELNEKPDQLAEAVRLSLLKVIELMTMPEPPQPKK